MLTSKLIRYHSKFTYINRPLNIRSMNQSIVNSSFGIRGEMINQAELLRKRIKSGEKLPFSSIISCNMGNPFALGKKPLTFPREVVSCIENTNLLKSNEISAEAKDRAKQILDSLDTNFGAYTKSAGIDVVRNHIVEFIKKRDGYPCKPDDIFLSEGATSAATLILQMLISEPNVGIMMPLPTYPLYTSETLIRNGNIVPFYFKESCGWRFDSDELTTF